MNVMSSVITCQRVHQQVLTCSAQLEPPSVKFSGELLLQFKGQRKEQKKQNPKPKVDKQEVEIRRGMTVEALAAAMDKDFDHVLEALLNTSVDLDSLTPDSVLDEAWIKEVVTRSGMKFRWAKLSASRERPNRDVQRRYRFGSRVFCREV
uniref:Uncharacterized protein n=1 Tax=Fundulus heteroclitus TaxID=8078 RepID=A0A3Q2P113_FUNHE